MARTMSSALGGFVVVRECMENPCYLRARLYGGYSGHHRRRGSCASHASSTGWTLDRGHFLMFTRRNGDARYLHGRHSWIVHGFRGAHLGRCIPFLLSIRCPKSIWMEKRPGPVLRELDPGVGGRQEACRTVHMLGISCPVIICLHRSESVGNRLWRFLNKCTREMYTPPRVEGQGHYVTRTHPDVPQLLLTVNLHLD